MAAPCSARTCVVMPVYNEAPTVASVLDAVRAVFDGWIVVIDDGSTDDTAAIVRRRDDVILIQHEVNGGYGAALAQGFRTAIDLGANTVISMDVDGQHEPRHIAEFCAEIEACGADVVSGSRYLPGSGSTGEAPPNRRAINHQVTEMINDVTGWGLTDAFCGFKAYRAEALERVRIDEPGYAMPLEFWARAWRAGLTVCEMPVERIYCDHDRSFGHDLDDPETRMSYYLRVWDRAMNEEAHAGSGEGIDG